MGGTIEKIVSAPLKLIGVDPAGDAQRMADQQAAAIKASSEQMAAQAKETARGTAMQQENAAARAKVEQQILDAKAPTEAASAEVNVAQRKTPTSRKRAAYQSPATPAGNTIRI